MIFLILQGFLSRKFLQDWENLYVFGEKFENQIIEELDNKFVYV